ncbi:MAG: hypothetical protein ACT6Q8_00690 [Niveispirillum sp.]|uniref:hypothetical protein n=1 Tax=Niveispirillum sp. TaxID=1917217 RepID=UPI004036DF0C
MRMMAVIGSALLLAMSGFGAMSFEPKPFCAEPGRSEWLGDAESIDLGCMGPTSPDGRYTLAIDAETEETRGAVIIDTASRQSVHRFDPLISIPAAFAWAPDSLALFADDGDGSGQFSRLRLFIFESGRFKEVAGLNDSALALFKDAARCRLPDIGANIWGIQWDPDGRRLLAFIQQDHHTICPDQMATEVFGLEVSLDKPLSPRLFGKEELRQRAGTLLPQRLFED